MARPSDHAGCWDTLCSVVDTQSQFPARGVGLFG